MEFFDRIANAVQKHVIERNDNSDLAFEDLSDSPQNSAFKRSVGDYYIYETELALCSPIQFIKRYLNYPIIERAIKINPNIKSILNENALEARFEIANATSIIMSHLIPCAKTAQNIYKKIGHKETELNYLHLTQAALLHDIGKVFIPSSILLKKGRLSSSERQIVELHNLLGYEVIKTTNLNPLVAKFIYEHHNYSGKVARNDENQALTVADVYCALREKRPYKRPLGDLTAKTILYDMGTKGQFDTKYISYI